MRGGFETGPAQWIGRLEAAIEWENTERRSDAASGWLGGLFNAKTRSRGYPRFTGGPPCGEVALCYGGLVRPAQDDRELGAGRRHTDRGRVGALGGHGRASAGGPFSLEPGASGAVEERERRDHCQNYDQERGPHVSRLSSQAFASPAVSSAQLCEHAEEALASI